MSEVIEFPKPKTAQPAELSRCHTTAQFVWLTAIPHKTRTSRFLYVIGAKHWPLSKLFTFSLADARAAAESFGVPVKEHGPLEAFADTATTESPPDGQPSQSTTDAFWFLVRQGDPERLKSWLRDHPKDAPALVKLLERA
jgi:hypothetical protein